MTQEKEEAPEGDRFLARLRLVAQIERLIEALETADLGDEGPQGIGSDAEVLVVARGIDGLQRLIAEWREAVGIT
jgi:hypothetical protein